MPNFDWKSFLGNDFQRRPIQLIGAWGSAIWLSFLVIILARQYGYWPGETGEALDANELGDTFSGFFSALAFFWFVLGYFQQGEELRQTREEVQLQRKALELQHLEMVDQKIALENTVWENAQQVIALGENRKAMVTSGFLGNLQHRFQMLDFLAERISVHVSHDEKLDEPVRFLLSKDMNLTILQFHMNIAYEIDSTIKMDGQISSAIKNYREGNTLGNPKNKIKYGRKSCDEFYEFLESIKKYNSYFENVMNDADLYDVDGLAKRAVFETLYGALYNTISGDIAVAGAISPDGEVMARVNK
ncbi:hypothetical protein [Thalassobaculum salexigens]|uniref:hypothetical protein n=1 Tax=Thalassobaculum salexigens TaxID=455360 RepID=UPI00248D401A|nr:hypothetical protein [Thalassobaculum salexigens]